MESQSVWTEFFFPDAFVDHDVGPRGDTRVGSGVFPQVTVMNTPRAIQHNPEGCNLYNKDGLTASPFMTDDW